MAKPPSTQLLQREIDAAKMLKEALAAIPAMDDETVRDTIEGETGLHEAIAAVLADIDEDEILREGIAQIVQKLSTRAGRLQDRIDARKRAIQRAMEVGELKKLTLPAATLSLRAVPRNLEITDEAAIPFEYWVPQPTKLDRKKVKEDLAAGKEVPGAVLDNGGTTLAVRRS